MHGMVGVYSWTGNSFPRMQGVSASVDKVDDCGCSDAFICLAGGDTFNTINRTSGRWVDATFFLSLSKLLNVQFLLFSASMADIATTTSTGQYGSVADPATGTRIPLLTATLIYQGGNDGPLPRAVATVPIIGTGSHYCFARLAAGVSLLPYGPSETVRSHALHPPGAVQPYLVLPSSMQTTVPAGRVVGEVQTIPCGVNVEPMPSARLSTPTLQASLRAFLGAQRKLPSDGLLPMIGNKQW